ncbi:MAG: hypothetical protein AB1896_22365 [Thermodesulfobacteriota bacterium]
MHELRNNVEVRRAISPVVGVDNTPLVSQIIDKGLYRALEFVIATGTLADADATFTTLVEHGDAANLSDAAAVPDADLIGTEAGASFDIADDDSVFKIGYKGSKRYVRLTITPANNTGNAPVAAVALLARGMSAPVS